MLKLFSKVPASVWLVACCVCGPLARAQDEAGTVPSTLEEISKAVGDTKTDLEASDLDDASRSRIQDQLDEARERLDEAETSLRRKAELELLLKDAPVRKEALTAELAETPAVDEVDLSGKVQELRRAVEQARASLSQLEQDRVAKERELSDLEARPLKISSRLSEANAELARARADLASLKEFDRESLSRVAERLLARVEVEALTAEIAMMEAERTALPVREELVLLEQQQVEERVRFAKEQLDRMERALDGRITGQLAGMRSRVAEVIDGMPKDRPELVTIAEGLPGLVDAFGEQSAQLAQLSVRIERMREEWDDLRSDNETIRRQIGLSGLEGAFTQVMLEEAQELPSRRGLDYNIKQLEQELSKAQLLSLQIERMQDQQEEFENRWQDDPAAAPVIAARASVLDSLASGQRALVRELAQLGTDKTAYRDMAVAMGDFLTEQLFWRRSSEPIGPGFFQSLPSSVGVILSPDPWREVLTAIQVMPRRHPVGTTVVSVLVLLLVALRGRLWRSIEQSGHRIRRISTDRLIHTLRALLQTLLLALPLPLALGFLSWSLATEPGASSWVRGFGLWLGWAATILLWINALRELDREGGVGGAHLGWDPDALDLLRKWLPRLAWIYIPSILIAAITIFDSESHAFDTVGRLGFIVSQLGLAWVMAGLFHPATGVFSRINEERPNRLMVRGRSFWFAVLVGIPLALALMSGGGYTLTAFTLSEQFIFVLRWIVVGVLIYGIGVRWFTIKGRRLALDEAIAERKARREAAKKDEDEGEGEETVVLDDDEIELGLDAVGQQTRRLLRSVVGAGVMVAIAYGVAADLPIDQAAGLSITGQLTWLGLLKAILIGAVTLTVVKNLPGLMDLLGLRQSGMEPGTRYALATLCQYALAAIGIFLVTTALALDWAKFSWIAAALSVGLGFGLQEVVANFVCGIILLFERPMRVGDVVTVGDVTGTVSRIRMRATTITNWERQEFVVPNKDFVTGSLINWTLTNPLNRITIEVGVAYGTDTTEARRILAEIADAHPVVLADPSPLINFEAFGDSTLNLSMRCYLPNMENRLKTVTELNEEIDRRFKEANIEIAFPQQDLHVRTIPDEMLRAESTVKQGS